MSPHEVNTRNLTVTETHNTYASGVASNKNNIINTYLASTTSYNTIGGVGGTQTQFKQQNFNFDQTSSNLISSNGYFGPAATSQLVKPNSTLYGYNASLPIARVDNGFSSSTGSSFSGTFPGNCVLNGSASTFTTTAMGTITISIAFGSDPGRLT